MKEKTEHNDEPFLRDAEVSRAIKDMSPAKLSVKDVYFRLCACLDREIELVWKRAVFLTAFLIAAFAGYGGLIAAYIGIDKPRLGTFAAISIAAIGIAFVGMALSVIWIMMAKGSKAWQEHYEKVIECFVARHDQEIDKANQDDKEWALPIFESGYYLGRTGEKSLADIGLKKKHISGGLLNCYGGPYSVSKIVIGLGRIFATCWIFIAVVHALYLFRHDDLVYNVIIKYLGQSPKELNLILLSVCMLVAVLGVVAFVVFLINRILLSNSSFRSEYLTILKNNKEIKVNCNG